jgi:hypothetical protein
MPKTILKIFSVFFTPMMVIYIICYFFDKFMCAVIFLQRRFRFPPPDWLHVRKSHSHRGKRLASFCGACGIMYYTPDGIDVWHTQRERSVSGSITAVIPSFLRERNRCESASALSPIFSSAVFDQGSHHRKGLSLSLATHPTHYFAIVNDTLEKCLAQSQNQHGWRLFNVHKVG